MPIRDDEKFCKCFLADTEEEAEKLLKEYNGTLKLLSNKVATLTGLDKEDLYQEGIIGLARAKRDFDEERSENFKIFAIYKIKDAMREFGTTQSISIKAPQYTKDAIRLANVLREHLTKAGEYQYIALADMWNASSKYDGDSPLEISIQKSRQSLKNLADRSHTSVRQLLERSEMVPSFTSETPTDNNVEIEDETSEEVIIGKLDAAAIISRLKEFLSKEEYELLWNRYVEGMTVRELAPIMGISAPHVSDRTQALLGKIKKVESDLLGKKVMRHESNTDIEEVKPRYAG
jgi:RNA polymerase sporulation-specific sigma factor